MQWIAIERFHTVHIYNTKGLLEAMTRAWTLRQGMEYKKLKDNKLLIEFNSAGDFNFVMGGGPWIYHGNALLVVSYDGISRTSEIPLNVLLV